MADIKHKLKKYKYYLSSDPDIDKIMLVFNKLAILPVTISLLQDTGIGKVVNSFRKTEGEIGQKAKDLVSKWKSLVTEEIVSTDLSHSGKTTENVNNESEAEAVEEEQQIDEDEERENDETEGQLNDSPDHEDTSTNSPEYTRINKINYTSSNSQHSDKSKSSSTKKHGDHSSHDKQRSSTSGDKYSHKNSSQKSSSGSHDKHSSSKSSTGSHEKNSSLKSSTSSHDKNSSVKNSTGLHDKHSSGKGSSGSHDKNSSVKSSSNNSSTLAHVHKSEKSTSHKSLHSKDSSSKGNSSDKYSLSSKHKSTKSSSCDKNSDSGQQNSLKNSSRHGHSSSSSNISLSEKNKHALESENVGSNLSDDDVHSPNFSDHCSSKDDSRNKTEHVLSHNVLSSSSKSESREKSKSAEHSLTGIKKESSHSHEKNKVSVSSSKEVIKTSGKSESHEKDVKNSEHSSKKSTHDGGSKSKHPGSSSHKSEHGSGKSVKHSGTSSSKSHKSEHKSGESKSSKHHSSSSTSSKHKSTENSLKHSVHTSVKDGDKVTKHSSEKDSKSKEKHHSSKISQVSSSSDKSTTKSSKDASPSTSSNVEHDMYTGIPSSEEDEDVTPGHSSSSKTGRKAQCFDENIFDLFTVDGGEKVTKSLSKGGHSSERSSSKSHKHSKHSGSSVKEESSKHRSKHREKSESKKVNHDSNNFDLQTESDLVKSKKRKHEVLIDESQMSFDDFLSYDITATSKKSKVSSKTGDVSGTLNDKFKVTKKPNTESKTDNSAKGGNSHSFPRDDDLPPKREGEGFVVPVPTKQMKITENDILCYLPETQAHYRPWRYNQIEDDKSEKDLDSLKFTKKAYARTQVYSGKRQICTEMKSLFDICMGVLIDNIDSIDSVGGIPFDILKPVVERASPVQLYSLEDNNPHFLESTNYLWEQHCKRDFRLSKPDEMESWRELYLRNFDEREAKFERLKGKMAATVNKQISEAKKVQLAYVDTVAKPPREVLRMQRMHGTASVSKPRKPDGASSWSRSKLPQRNYDSPVRPQKAVKTIAPMMQKTMKMIKKIRR